MGLLIGRIRLDPGYDAKGTGGRFVGKDTALRNRVSPHGRERICLP